MDIQNVDNSQTATMSTNTGADEAEGIWSADIEQSFLEALAIYPPCGRRKIILTEEGKMYGRNELVARYIKIRTGKTRTRKQVSSHLQVLAKRRSKELQALRNDKNAQQIILQRLKQLTSAEIVSMGHEQIITTNTDAMVDESSEQQSKTYLSRSENLIQPMSLASPSVFHALTAKEEFDLSDDNHATIGSPGVKKMASRKISSKDKSNTSKSMSSTNSIHSALLPTSPNIFHHDFGRSRCSSNTSSSSPLSTGSIGSQSLAIPSNSQGLSPIVIGDEHFRVHELSAYLEIRHTLMSGNNPTLFFQPPETDHAYQRHILRLHTSDIQMKTVQTLETISVDQISDKFPRHDGLKDLFEKYPSSPFFLIKFWGNVLNTPNMINVDESFFTTFTYIRSTNRPIHISTRLCSFGRQVLEKVDTSEHPHRDSCDQYIHRFDRSPLCDYMVQFIQKLRSLPNTYMMNSVLENFTILQTIKCFNNPEQLLLCLAFVFEINVMDSVGPQYQVYKLVSN